MKPLTVHVDLAERSYDIIIGHGILSSVQDYLPFEIEGKKIFIITDINVRPYAEDLRHRFKDLGASWCELLAFSAGEAIKSYDRLKDTHEWMLANNVHRDSVVVAVGGGVIGDLTGFAASSVLRGVPYVQIPTSLLAQVDSSVGGKTGINTPYGKNLVGSFYQPVGVVIDTETLKTLPARELLSGYAEIVKYGLIGDREFFEWLEIRNGKRVVSTHPEEIARAIEVCCKAKAEVVKADEREGGVRTLLNLGHTFGHAFETLAGYDGSLLHGEAVSLGMVLAFDLSVRMGLCPAEDRDRVVRHFDEVGLPVCAKDTNAKAAILNASIEEYKDIMRRDKKAHNGKTVFVLVRGIGEAFVHKDVPENMVDATLANFLKRD